MSIRNRIDEYKASLALRRVFFRVANAQPESLRSSVLARLSALNQEPTQ